LIEDYFPSNPLGPAETAKALYAVVRNPLTHALGVSENRVLVAKDRLTAEQITELEEATKRPAWCPPPVSRADGVYTVDARGLYWAFHRLLHNLFAAPQHVGLADRLAGEIGFG